jgi:hypothetical protein
MDYLKAKIPYKSARRSRRTGSLISRSTNENRQSSPSINASSGSSAHFNYALKSVLQSTSNDDPPYVEHSGDKSQYVRDVVLGVNDGLVSMFLLQTGSWNAGLTNRQTLLFGVCGEAVFLFC